MDDMDCYVALRGYDDLFALSDLPAKKKELYDELG